MERVINANPDHPDGTSKHVGCRGAGWLIRLIIDRGLTSLHPLVHKALSGLSGWSYLSKGVYNLGFRERGIIYFLYM